MFISQGKRVHLVLNGKSYLSLGMMPNEYKTAGYHKEVPLYLGEDLNIKTSSEYGSPFQSMQEGAVTLGQALQVVGAAGQVLGLGEGNKFTDASAQSKFSSYQFWKYSNPISFSFVINLFVGVADLYNAKQEVYLPSLRLQELVLPTESNDSVIKVGDLRMPSGLIPPGPTISSFLKETGMTKTSSDNNFSMVIGNIIELNSCIIKNVEATFSKEVDELGYPIKSTVRLEVSSTTVATTNMLRESLVKSNLKNVTLVDPKISGRGGNIQ